jgi:threonine dehydratase
MTGMDDSVTFASIAKAVEALRGVAHITPVMTSRQLDAIIQGQVFLKCEQLQRTGAFKFRGAYHALSVLKTRGKCRAVATISSGNHGQGLALAASLFGLTAYVVMPAPISRLKQRAIVAHGGIVSVAESRSSAEQKLREVLRQEQAVWVHAFNDPRVIAGQGTTMLELMEQVAGLDVLLAPVGGGGLLSGLCVAGHHVLPDLKIFACEPDGAFDAAASIRLNTIVPMNNPHTLADGLCTSLGDWTLPILRAHLAGVLAVTEQEILAAMRFAHAQLRLVIEPSSAVALAPVLRQEPALIGKRVGVVLTGGNVDFETVRDLSVSDRPNAPTFERMS